MASPININSQNHKQTSGIKDFKTSKKKPLVINSKKVQKVGAAGLFKPEEVELSIISSTTGQQSDSSNSFGNVCTSLSNNKLISKVSLTLEKTLDASIQCSDNSIKWFRSK